jgi:hypothetical protein
MHRREKIRLTLDRIKVTKSLVDGLIEFISLARTAGYEPAYSARTLERFQAELSELRAALTRLTISGQKDLATRSVISHGEMKRAA